MAALDLDAFRNRLIERREQLVRDQGAALQHVGRSAESAVPDAVDMASEASDFDVAVGAARMEGEELAAIAAALERIDRDEFGACVDCGEAINVKRLEALPFARLCIECQRVFEIHGPRDEAAPVGASDDS